jgi:integrase
MKLVTNNTSGRIYARLKTGNAQKPYLKISLGTKSAEEAKQKAGAANLKAIESALQAGQLSKQAIARLTTGKKQTVAGLIPEWLLSLRRRSISESTIAKNEAVFNHWFAVVPEVAGLAPMSVTETQVDSFINRTDADAGQATRQRQLSVLRTFFAYCADWGFVSGNPAGKHRVGVQHRNLSFAQREKKKVLPFTDAEVRRILADTEGWWRWAVGIGAATGLRLGDICQLEHASFGVPNHIVVFTDKRDRRVCLPINSTITPGLAEILSEIPPSDSPYLFPEQKEQYDDLKTGRPKFSVYFGRILQRLGIENRSFHGLRHHAITRWHKAGFKLELCADFAGHTSTKVTQGYIAG